MGVRSEPVKKCALLHLVNVRAQVDPPMSKHNFGNVIWQSRANPGAGDDGAEVVRKMRDAVNAVDGGYVAGLKGGDNFMEENAGLVCDEGVVCLGFTSLVGFPFHEVDFEFGKPVWVGLGWFPLMNTVYFRDANFGGIEVLIVLSKHDMEKFQESFFMSKL
ncbi:stemmadenine O-acetyltransferase-like [Salvia hispanica]|uniref:stemmadenine O-acetyltransferase-like n=1 Tax=Salvia hispanica TaxID=49212 RepID=UPI0020091B10|nr:stemmadenine O-acetyltransferase-like [Salvia hispanica]